MSNGYLRLVLNSIKPLLGEFRIEIDREKRLVKIIQKVQTSVLTYDQVIDQIEVLFDDAEHPRQDNPGAY